MSMQPPPSAPTSAPPPEVEPGQGHGAFSEAEIQQIMAETGYSYEAVCQAIDQTGATSKETLFPAVYSGQGIDPSTMQDPSAPVAPPMQPAAAPPVMAPTEGAPSPEMTPQMAAPGAMQGIPPELAQAMHKEMAPHLGLPLKGRMKR